MSGLPKIFVFMRNSSATDTVFWTALAEDGTGLVDSGVASSIPWARYDSGLTAPSNVHPNPTQYGKHYPGGYEVIDWSPEYALARPDLLETFDAALAAFALRRTT